MFLLVTAFSLIATTSAIQLTAVESAEVSLKLIHPQEEDVLQDEEAQIVDGQEIVFEEIESDLELDDEE